MNEKSEKEIGKEPQSWLLPPVGKETVSKVMKEFEADPLKFTLKALKEMEKNNPELYKFLLWRWGKKWGKELIMKVTQQPQEILSWKERHHLYFLEGAALADQCLSYEAKKRKIALPRVLREIIQGFLGDLKKWEIFERKNELYSILPLLSSYSKENSAVTAGATYVYLFRRRQAEVNYLEKKLQGQ